MAGDSPSPAPPSSFLLNPKLSLLFANSSPVSLIHRRSCRIMHKRLSLDVLEPWTSLERSASHCILNFFPTNCDCTYFCVSALRTLLDSYPHACISQGISPKIVA